MASIGIPILLAPISWYLIQKSWSLVWHHSLIHDCTSAWSSQETLVPGWRSHSSWTTAMHLLSKSCSGPRNTLSGIPIGSLLLCQCFLLVPYCCRHSLLVPYCCRRFLLVPYCCVIIPYWFPTTLAGVSIGLPLLSWSATLHKSIINIIIGSDLVPSHQCSGFVDFLPKQSVWSSLKWWRLLSVYLCVPSCSTV